MKSHIIGLIALLLQLGVALYGAAQWYKLGQNDTHRQIASIDSSLLKVAYGIAQENQSQIEEDIYVFEREGIGLDFLLAEGAISQYVKEVYKKLDFLYHQSDSKEQELKKVLTLAQQQLPLIIAKYLKDTIITVEYRQKMTQLEQLAGEHTSFAQAMLIVALSEREGLNIMGERYSYHWPHFPLFKAQALPQTETLQPNDTLQLGIYLAAKKYNLNFMALISGKSYYRSPDNWAYYETILRDTGTFQLKGIVYPPNCPTCTQKNYPFSRLYTVEKCP